MNKFILILKNAVKSLFSNKKRLILSSLGISLSAFLFIFLQIAILLPQHMAFANYQNFPKDTILINGDFDYNKLEQLEDKNFKYTYATKPMQFEIKDRPNVKALSYGVNKNFLDFPVLHTSSKDSLEITRLLYGRTINEIDLIKQRLVIIINQTTAKLIFDEEEEAIGKVIGMVGNDNRIYNFTVIGIINDTPSIYVSNAKVVEKINLGNLPTMELHCYIPYTVFSYFLDSKINNIIIRSSYEPESIVTYISSLLEPTNIETYTYKQHFLKFKQDIADTNYALLIIKTIVMIFSTINLTVILLFSLKDRVFEIGIKKALGASNEDIMIQFQIEAFIIGIFGSVIGIVLGGYLSSLFALKLSFDFGVSLVSINFVDYIYNIIFIQFFVLIASIIPCYVAANKNILKALRID